MYIQKNIQQIDNILSRQGRIKVLTNRDKINRWFRWLRYGI